MVEVPQEEHISEGVDVGDADVEFELGVLPETPPLDLLLDLLSDRPQEMGLEDALAQPAHFAHTAVLGTIPRKLFLVVAEQNRQDLSQQGRIRVESGVFEVVKAEDTAHTEFVLEQEGLKQPSRRLQGIEGTLVADELGR